MKNALGLAVAVVAVAGFLSLYGASPLMIALAAGFIIAVAVLAPRFRS